MNTPARCEAVGTRDPLPPERTPLEIALGAGEPLPWPASLSEEIALEERRLAADLPPTARRSEKEITRIYALLDSLQPKGHSNV